jgi:hypothetical protein
MKNKLKAIIKLLKSDEYLLVTTKEKNNSIIHYDYDTNVNRDLFWIFLNSYLAEQKKINYDK